MNGGAPLFVCSSGPAGSLLAGKPAAHLLFTSSEEPQTLEGSIWGRVRDRGREHFRHASLRLFNGDFICIRKEMVLYRVDKLRHVKEFPLM